MMGHGDRRGLGAFELIRPEFGERAVLDLMKTGEERREPVTGRKIAPDRLITERTTKPSPRPLKECRLGPERIVMYDRRFEQRGAPALIIGESGGRLRKTVIIGRHVLADHIHGTYATIDMANRAVPERNSLR